MSVFGARRVGVGGEVRSSRVGQRHAGRRGRWRRGRRDRAGRCQAVAGLAGQLVEGAALQRSFPPTPARPRADAGRTGPGGGGLDKAISRCQQILPHMRRPRRAVKQSAVQMAFTRTITLNFGGQASMANPAPPRNDVEETGSLMAKGTVHRAGGRRRSFPPLRRHRGRRRRGDLDRQPQGGHEGRRPGQRQAAQPGRLAGRPQGVGQDHRPTRPRSSPQLPKGSGAESGEKTKAKAEIFQRRQGFKAEGDKAIRPPRRSQRQDEATGKAAAKEVLGNCTSATTSTARNRLRLKR